ncbi:MAG TPA: FKBP-type peptidyl-prolyl cis-trans isomerase [Mucilaginibacter sp.]|nr:FKBP-type peptidyl-prolyl cis-trans isomerase [Mucilaginibacter sp.]
MKKIALLMVLLAAITIKVRAQAQDEFARTPKGDLCKKLTNNPGDKIKLNDVVTFDIIQKTEKDSLLGSTYMMGHPVKIQIQPSQNASDMMDVFPLLAAQDSAYVKVPTDSLFKGHEDQRPAFLPKGSFLVYLVKIHKIQSLNDAIAERNKGLDSMRVAETTAEGKYIADNKLTPKTTPSGLKYFITKSSLKPKPRVGDTILVNYTGHTLDGKVFDSSVAADAAKAGLNQPGRNYEPLQFVVGTGAVIKGWDEGWLLINEGAKAEFIIPSNLAYGSEGSGDIGPFATLVFDVELVKIKPIKHPVAAKPAAKKGVVKKHTTVKKSTSPPVAQH